MTDVIIVVGAGGAAFVAIYDLRITRRVTAAILGIHLGMQAA
jgi:hypothetical protein